MTFVTLSDVGTAHQAFNQPNQDSADFREADGDFVLAVSDGVGSCKYADRGSKAVIDSCISTFNTLKTCSLCFDSRQVAQNIWTEWQSILAGENLDDCCATVKAAFKYGNSIWTMTLEPRFLAGNFYVYTDGKRIDRKWNSDLTDYQETVVYEDGQGEFLLLYNGTIKWIDETEQFAHNDVFNLYSY